MISFWGSFFLCYSNVSTFWVILIWGDIIHWIRVGIYLETHIALIYPRSRVLGLSFLLGFQRWRKMLLYNWFSFWFFVNYCSYARFDFVGLAQALGSCFIVESSVRWCMPHLIYLLIWFWCFVQVGLPHLWLWDFVASRESGFP